MCRNVLGQHHRHTGERISVDGGDGVGGRKSVASGALAVDDRPEQQPDHAVGDPGVDAPVEEGDVHGPLRALVVCQLRVPASNVRLSDVNNVSWACSYKGRW